MEDLVKVIGVGCVAVGTSYIGWAWLGPVQAGRFRLRDLVSPRRMEEGSRTQLLLEGGVTLVVGILVLLLI